MSQTSPGIKSALRTLGIGVLLVVGLLILNASAFVVDETEQAIVVQLGRPVGEPKNKPGLYFKMPIVQDVRRFDKRILAWDGDPNEVPTRGREFIHVDATARWRIVDPLLFLQSVGNESVARSRLDDILDSAIRDAISSMDLQEIVRSKDWAVNPEELTSEMRMSDEDEATLTEPILIGREGLQERVLQRIKPDTLSFGVELLDVRIKRLNYIASVRSKVYDRMTSERKRIAAQFRSEGEGRSQEILGRTEKERQGIISLAQREVETIRGTADAEATRIYGEAYNAAPEFYAFLRTLEAYERAITARSTLLLNTDTDFFRYLKSTGKGADDLGDLDIPGRLERLKATRAPESSFDPESILTESIDQILAPTDTTPPTEETPPAEE